MYCIVAFYIRFIKACIKLRKKAETSKQICKTDQYLGFSGNRDPVSAGSWRCVEHGFKANPDSIPPPAAAGATVRLERVHRGGGECHGGGDRGRPGQQVRAGQTRTRSQASLVSAGSCTCCSARSPLPRATAWSTWATVTTMTWVTASWASCTRPPSPSWTASTSRSWGPAADPCARQGQF